TEIMSTPFNDDVDNTSILDQPILRRRISTSTTSTSSSTTDTSLSSSSSSTSSSQDRPMSDDGMFECNICFDNVSEPVVTQCGHLFCWSCIFQWLQHNPSQQCPVCKAPVTEEKLIPIYGRGSNKTDPRKNRTIPQRPPGRPEQARPNANGRAPPYFQDIFGTNQWNTQLGGVSFSAGFGFFPGLFGLHFYVSWRSLLRSYSFTHSFIHSLM
ncbi:hypothetical protein SAMD00019534_047920, partial [Acytostelium subglobosum LB1]|uniref:hypothetical protein n=1 Tax=Acytostelium subglobosum LB1 TaxID=1410327 RepID=UPI000644FFB7